MVAKLTLLSCAAMLLAVVSGQDYAATTSTTNAPPAAKASPPPPAKTPSPAPVVVISMNTSNTTTVRMRKGRRLSGSGSVGSVFYTSGCFGRRAARSRLHQPPPATAYSGSCGSADARACDTPRQG